MLMRVCFGLTSLFMLGTNGAGAKPSAGVSPSQPSNIKVQVNEVIVPATVIDAERPICFDLDKRIPQSLEEDKEQSIESFHA